MSKLYDELARVYHEMYQSIFNYKEEFELYNKLLRKYGCSAMLELGCGSGNLAAYFANGDYSYTGADLSEGMLAIARENNPGKRFLHKDMRNLDMVEEYDSVLITGRSFTYMRTNEDVNRCLSSVNRALMPGGILAFDNFNAREIFLDFWPHIEQESEVNGKTYKRISNNTMNMENGWTWNWDATYIIEEKDKEPMVIEDKSILRAFTEDEIRLFLEFNGFEVLEVELQGVSLAVVARKI
jgi:SAM-dependent methyltransferase